MLSAFMPTPTTVKKVGFDDVLFVIKHPAEYILINTLPANEQGTLITGTLPFHKEEEKINGIIEKREFGRWKIVIYGKNTTDSTVETKYRQLRGFGFMDVYVYYGGLFEWAMLQDIYGRDFFELSVVGTEKRVAIDILKWKPHAFFN
jgi:hypothetical protein